MEDKEEIKNQVKEELNVLGNQLMEISNKILLAEGVLGAKISIEVQNILGMAQAHIDVKVTNPKAMPGMPDAKSSDPEPASATPVNIDEELKKILKQDGK